MTGKLEFLRGVTHEQEATAEFENIVTNDPELSSGNIMYGYPLFTPMDKPSMSPTPSSSHPTAKSPSSTCAKRPCPRTTGKHRTTASWPSTGR